MNVIIIFNYKYFSNNIITFINMLLITLQNLKLNFKLNITNCQRYYL